MLHIKWNTHTHTRAIKTPLAGDLMPFHVIAKAVTMIQHPTLSSKIRNILTGANCCCKGEKGNIYIITCMLLPAQQQRTAIPFQFTSKVLSFMAPWGCIHELKNTHRLTDVRQNATGKSNTTKYLVANFFKNKNSSHNHSCTINTEQMGYDESRTYLEYSNQGDKKLLYKTCTVILHRMLHKQVNCCT